MPEQNGEKSQEPTQHRRQEARKQGQVAKSQDLGSAVLLLLGLVALMMLGKPLVEFQFQFLQRQLGGPAWLAADVDFAVAEWHWLVGAMAKSVLPLFSVLLVGMVLVNLMQIGLLFLPDKLAPDITRLDPIKGLGRMFSMPSFMRLAFGIFKILVIGTVAAVSLYNERHTILGLTGLATSELALYLTEILLWTAVKMAIALLLLALLDYAFQKWKHEQDLKMTTQEVREEMKNLEGDPQVMARRRAVQRQLAMNRLSSAVPDADVVVTNPTELAVAIKYDAAKMAAPIVVAKGAGVVAQRIRKLALENGIPIVERKPLAQALYKEVEVNEMVPEERYAAVAEVLAYVYQLKGKRPPMAA